MVTLRECEPADAPSLLEHLSDGRVQQFIDPPPPTLDGFRRFVEWTHRVRSEGRYLCFGVVPRDRQVAVGIMQLWPIDSQCAVSEAGFAIGSAFWGTGIFHAGANLLFDFAFDALGVRRIEMRVACTNVRALAAIRKLGAVEEGVLRRCFVIGGKPVDHVLWSIVAEDWHRRSADAA
jgi:RimJ/RimL family protein N-acetyltransferase